MGMTTKMIGASASLPRLARSFAALPDTFKALWVEKPEKKGPTSVDVRELPFSMLPEGDVTVKVSHSTINYKDGMAVKGLPGIAKSYPHIPGVDFVGTVAHSKTPEWKEGDEVIVTGWQVGETRWGGLAEYCTVEKHMLIPKPASISPLEAMALGTAGFTAMLSVMNLERFGAQKDAKYPMLVTGASGGVGSCGVVLLANLGYNVEALTGSESNREFLMGLGASDIVLREEFSGDARPLDKIRWSGGIDVAGGNALAHMLSHMDKDSCIAVCGLADSPALNCTVMPFILRGVRIAGIDSCFSVYEERVEAWDRLAVEFPRHLLTDVMEVHGLEDVLQISEDILQGKVNGRMVIDVAK